AGVCEKVVAARAQVGFCQDPDADGLAIIDEQGRYIGEENTLAICLDHLLGDAKGPIVTNCATSRMAEDLAKVHGVSFHRSAVGEANVVDKMLEVGAIFGGEGNGGPIDPRVGYVRDSFGGYFAMIGLEWLLSENKVRFPWRAVVVGTLLQFALAMLILSTTPGRVVFEGIGAAFTWVSDMADEGSKFVFGERFLEHPFAF